MPPATQETSRSRGLQWKPNSPVAARARSEAARPEASVTDLPTR